MARTMSARLILHPGKPDERVIELHPGATTIGRTADSDVCLPHRSLSRLHARISVDGPSVVLEDMQSRNGTFVDGVRVTRRELGRAHWIKCGDVLFSFVGEPLRPSTSPPPAPTTVRDVGLDPARRPLADLLAQTDRDRLQVLLRVSELLSSPASLDDLLARVLDLAFRILDADRGALLLRGPTGELDARITRVREGVPAPAGPVYSRQIVRWSLDRGVAALFSDARHDPRVGGGSVLAQSVGASMCAPLTPRDHPPIGALYVDTVGRPRRFDSDDLDLMTAFANQAAIAIHHGMLGARLAEEAMVRNDLLRFFPPNAVDAVVGRGGRLDPYETEATVLFCDISGYTELSAELAPSELLELLNAYLPVVADVVFCHEGTLEKYIGDAVLAIWGAPIAHADDPERAVRAAVDMQRAVAALAADLGRPLSVHIGIDTGRVAAGNVGSSRYLQFATIGEATSLASRICTAAAPGEILVGEATARRLRDVDLEPLAPVSVKGRAAPLALFRVAWK
jgi:adenylate cyclase